MIQRDYLVIGAGAAGDAVCEGIRKYDKKGTILMTGAEHWCTYDRTALSKDFLSATKPSATALKLHPEDWASKNKIDFRIGVPVTQLNIERRLAVLATGQAVEFNKACLCTGSRARRPLVAGANLGNIFYLRNLPDALALKEVTALEKQVVVVGGGLLAAEACSALLKSKCKLTLLDRNEFLWGDRVDADTARWLSGLFEAAGVQRLARESLNGFEGKTVLRNVQTKSGHRFPASVAVVAVGAEPNLELVANTPLNSPLGTPVNDLLETEEKGVYAAGDIALYPDRIFGGMRRTEHWRSAREQGLVAGSNMTGKKRIRFQTLPEWESRVLDLHFHFVGDFSRLPARTEIVGDREKQNFIARYFQGEKMVGALLCNRRNAVTELQEIRDAILKSQSHK
jgi:NADPH-dependent 2,4-dienoyl-CoA reductase/sulfur reductase-like enzyme